MSKITNDGLTTQSGTGCFIAVPIMATRGDKWLNTGGMRILRNFRPVSRYISETLRHIVTTIDYSRIACPHTSILRDHRWPWAIFQSHFGCFKVVDCQNLRMFCI